MRKELIACLTPCLRVSERPHALRRHRIRENDALGAECRRRFELAHYRWEVATRGIPPAGEVAEREKRPHRRSMAHSQHGSERGRLEHALSKPRESRAGSAVTGVTATTGDSFQVCVWAARFPCALDGCADTI